MDIFLRQLYRLYIVTINTILIFFETQEVASTNQVKFFASGDKKINNRAINENIYEKKYIKDGSSVLNKQTLLFLAQFSASVFS